MVQNKKSKLLGLKLDSSKLEAFDADYLDRLSEDELKWLKAFVKEYYEGVASLENNQEKIRASWRSDKARRRDIYANCDRLSINPEDPRHQNRTLRPAAKK